jgi:hypothetical protein
MGAITRFLLANSFEKRIRIVEMTEVDEPFSIQSPFVPFDTDPVLIKEDLDLPEG